jgi:hypothetical protein
MIGRMGRVLLGALLCASTASAQPSDWSTRSARTIEKGRIELGVFSAATWGVRERVEVAAHPLGMFLFPSARAKINWARGGALLHDGEQHAQATVWWFSTQHRLFAPPPFLHLIAREGSGGLLPANTEIPFSVGLENESLLTRSWGAHLFTASLAFTITGREKSDLPLVEFPFVYSALASLYSPIVLSPGVYSEGRIAGPLDYRVTARLHLFRPHERVAWPLDKPPWVYSQDTTLALQMRLGVRHRLSLGLASTVARFPIGTRFYYAPTLDYRLALF